MWMLSLYLHVNQKLDDDDDDDDDEDNLMLSLLGKNFSRLQFELDWTINGTSLQNPHALC